MTTATGSLWTIAEPCMSPAMTRSKNFPTAGAIQPANAGIFFNGFVTKIGAGGAPILYSTYLGGNFSDVLNGIAVDAQGRAHIVGHCALFEFPGGQPAQATHGGGVIPDVLLARLDRRRRARDTRPTGGRGEDMGFGIALGVRDRSGGSPLVAAYITGVTSSPDFPVVHAFQQTPGDAFVCVIPKTVPMREFSSMNGSENFRTASSCWPPGPWE